MVFFWDCTNLETVYIESAEGDVDIDEYAFGNCDATIVYNYKGSEEVTEPEEEDPYADYHWDINGDGNEDVIDLLMLKKHILGMI